MLKVLAKNTKIHTFKFTKTILFTEKVRVQWKTKTSDGKENGFDNLSGIETFSSGEEVSHIEIKIDQKPQESAQDTFVVELIEPKNIFATLGEIPTCSITINNDIG